MKHLSYLLCVCALTLVSCGSTQPASVERITEVAEDHPTSIRLAGGTLHARRGLIVRNDSAWWFDDSTRQERAIATKEILAVGWHNHTQGLVNGLWMGPLVGATFGTLISAGQGFDGYSPIAIPVMAIVALPLGTIIGWATGEEQWLVPQR